MARWPASGLVGRDPFHLVKLVNSRVDEVRRRVEDAPWHRSRVSNGPTESMDNLIKRTKRVAFRFPRFRNLGVRALLYAGRPNWNLLATSTPR